MLFLKKGFHLIVHGTYTFEYPRLDSRFNQVLNKAMYNHTTIAIRNIVDVYMGFENMKQLVDVSGGVGVTLKVVTANYPYIKGINFDLSHVIQHAPRYPVNSLKLQKLGIRNCFTNSRRRLRHWKRRSSNLFWSWRRQNLLHPFSPAISTQTNPTPSTESTCHQLSTPLLHVSYQIVFISQKCKSGNWRGLFKESNTGSCLVTRRQTLLRNLRRYLLRSGTTIEQPEDKGREGRKPVTYGVVSKNQDSPSRERGEKRDNKGKAFCSVEETRKVNGFKVRMFYSLHKLRKKGGDDVAPPGDPD
ncbi:hypothetical protein Ddye_017418 [Dipteronia dyeriana]|uniref:O-methyltransferase C-terminal domain-containing protein n=1 Tax=Dipteronia dyeriana TaxID=168575 RepID=A0AAD9U953_9ROSI|nr:hypothetical protein Ddye_017418 [Dipteronia dyeriana]